MFNDAQIDKKMYGVPFIMHNIWILTVLVGTTKIKLVNWFDKLSITKSIGPNLQNSPLFLLCYSVPTILCHKNHVNILSLHRKKTHKLTFYTIKKGLQCYFVQLCTRNYNFSRNYNIKKNLSILCEKKFEFQAGIVEEKC